MPCRMVNSKTMGSPDFKMPEPSWCNNVNRLAGEYLFYVPVSLGTHCEKGNVGF